MKTCLIKNVFSKITITLFLVLMYPIAVQAQVDTVENYFPTKVGTTWVYKIYPQYSNERRHLIITKDSISTTDNSHYLFLNNSVGPSFRVDTLGNVYQNPLGLSRNSNWLVFKQYAQKYESWLVTDTTKDTSNTRGYARIKDIGIDFVINQFVKYKVVERGISCSICSPDSFNLSPYEYYGDGFGRYFVITEPSVTERVLVGFITNGDTLGDITKVIDLKNSQLSSFILHQNYPNPFNSSTTILYELKSEQIVTLKIFDLLGREVQELIHQRQSAGEHKVRFDADGLQSGMYLLQLKSGNFVQIKKILYLK